MQDYDTNVIRAVAALEEYHGKPLTSEARTYYVDALSKLPNLLVTSGIDRWKHHNSPSTRLPSLAQLRACIDDARTALWQQGKRTENKSPISQPAINPNSPDPDYDHARWDLVKRAASMSRKQLADAFDELHQRYPGHDWDGAARRLRVQISVQRGERGVAGREGSSPS